MAEIEVEESYETTTVRRKTVKQSFKIEEVSNRFEKLLIHKLETFPNHGDNVHQSLHYLWQNISLGDRSFQQLHTLVAHIYKEVCWNENCFVNAVTAHLLTF